MVSTKEIHQNIFCTVIRKPEILRKALKARYISAIGIAHQNSIMSADIHDYRLRTIDYQLTSINYRLLTDDYSTSS
jgi:hypothetical protein